MPPASAMTLPLCALRTIPQPDDAARHAQLLRTVADRSPLPVILYSFPQCTGYDLPAELVGELASTATSSE